MVTPSNLPQRNKPKLCKVNTVVVIAVLTLGLFAALRTPDDSLKFQDDQLELKKTERLGGKLQFGAITHACNAAVDRLVELKIKLIALDFDLTIIDIHTEGAWTRTALELVSHVRPEMQCLIQHSLAKGVQIAVASFSVQEQLIRDVIRDAIPPARDIVIRGGKNLSGPQGKRDQLTQVLHDIHSGTSGDKSILPANTILIDDDKNNIRGAKKDGYKSLWFDPHNAQGFFDSIMALQKTTPR